MTNNMLFILKLILIILLNKTSAYITQNNIETIILPTWNSTDRKEIPFTLKAFGKQIQLNLRRNDPVVSSAFKVWKHDVKIEGPPQLNASNFCCYHHKDHISSAVINLCQQYEWNGLVHLEDGTLEIRPFRDDFTLTDDSCVKEEINISFGKSHIIKRSLQLIDNSSFYDLEHHKLKQRHVQNRKRKLTIELAVFFDEAAYRTFMPLLKNEEMLRLMILAYVSNMQAMFHHSSLGTSIDLVLVYLEIMEKQSLDLPTFDGHDRELLDLFCKYAAARNTWNDDNPNHWDVGLYLTGINLSSIDHKTGISYRNGLCSSNESCAVVEFGGVTRDVQSGFSSSLNAVHEIGHLLDIRHDSAECETFQNIMSSHSTRYGQPIWSECNSKNTKYLWNTKRCLRDRTKPVNYYNDQSQFDYSPYNTLPGRKWTAKAQCEIFFRDEDANVVSLIDICKALQCETSKENGNSYFTGPALEGTYCAHGKECRGGECVTIIEPPYNFKYCDKDDWSEWKADSCKSNCLEKSKGVVIKRRFCKHGNYKTANCQEPYYNIALCNDSSLCKISRQTISNFAQIRCAKFEKFMAVFGNLSLEINYPGPQAPHDIKKPWIACTILCRRKDMHDYYAPRVEMILVGNDPYFPDGTWCHYENDQNYYCRQHYCLPESYS